MKKFFLAFVLGLLLAVLGFLVVDYFSINISEFLPKKTEIKVPETQSENPLPPKRPSNPAMSIDGRPFSTPFNAQSN